MMNRVILTGRLTKDPDVRYSNGEKATAIARFSLAVNRQFAKKDSGQLTADFINCVAFGKTGEFVEKYFRKGMKADICGRIQTGSYNDKDGRKVYTTDIVVEDIEFGESKNSNQAQNNAPASQLGMATDSDGFMSIPDGIDEELPFV